MSFRLALLVVCGIALSSSAGAQTASRSALVVSLTGELGSILLAAVPLAFLLAVALLALYLRAVRRSMRRRSGTAVPTSARVPGVAPSQSLGIIDVTSALASESSTKLPARSRAALLRLAAVYASAGIAASAVMTALYLYANGIAFLPLRSLYVAVGFAWPLVATLGLVAAISWRGWLLLVAGYAALMTAVVVPSLNETFTPVQALLAWVILNGPATLMATVFLARRIRAVGPLVMAFTFAAVSGVSVAVNAVGSSDARIRMVAAAGESLGLGGHQTFIAVMAVGFITLGLLGWVFLRLLGWLYRTRRVSDQTLMIDSLWLMFTVHHAIDMVFAGPIWFIVTFGSFAVYKLVAWLGLRLLRGLRSEPAPAPRLLLLRVFALGQRSQRLFAAFAKLWRPIGSVRMIAGPDLAATTVEPHEFLDFVAGKLGRRFIDGPAALDRRITETDAGRDVDQRFRVGEFFCHDDTWKMVLQRLAQESDAVLMDLRGFTAANKGCIFEIHALLDMVPLERIVLAIDRTTDERFLREVLDAGWRTLSEWSPNRADSAPSARLFRLDHVTQARALVRAVADAAGAA